MDDNECNVLKARLIPQPREIHFSEGDVFLVQDACKVQIKLAVPDGVAEEATWLFKNHWNAQADIALETEPALASMGNDGYELEIGKRLLRIKAKGITGVRNAFKTLRQLAEVRRGTEKVSGHFLVPCTVRDEPALAFRGMHICIFPETQLWDIEKQVRLAAYHKFNYAIIETWGVFPFESHPEFGWQDRKISRGELKRLISLGKELGITLIPQFNLLGHATASRLMTGKHAVLDANPALQPLFEPDGWSWCLSNPNTRRILGDLVLELHDFYERLPGLPPPGFEGACSRAHNVVP